MCIMGKHKTKNLDLVNESDSLSPQAKKYGIEEP